MCGATVAKRSSARSSENIRKHKKRKEGKAQWEQTHSQHRPLVDTCERFYRDETDISSLRFHFLPGVNDEAGITRQTRQQGRNGENGENGPRLGGKTCFSFRKKKLAPLTSALLHKCLVLGFHPSSRISNTCVNIKTSLFPFRKAFPPLSGHARGTNSRWDGQKRREENTEAHQQQ